MSSATANHVSKDESQIDWPVELNNLAFAHGRPNIYGRIKATPEDFVVREIMDVTPCGEGEHIWLDVSKVRNNTDRVARELAKFAGVAFRDVGYSGIKDFQAVTRQWFSIWRPKGSDLNWSKFEVEGVTVNTVAQHSRKIKRSTHSRNYFEICVRGLGLEQDAIAVLESTSFMQLGTRLELIAAQGVPNYFGPQRFGRNGSNIPQALAMFAGTKRVKDRNIRGLLLSSARSCIFNRVLSARVLDDTWDNLFPAEPVNLDGSNSTFLAANLAEEQKRIRSLDIHPTAPMWGEGRAEFKTACPALENFEAACLANYRELQHGLESARLAHQRRATRAVPRNLNWAFKDDTLMLSFELLPGQYATSVLREIVRESVY